MNWLSVKDTVFNDDKNIVYLVFSPIDGMGLATLYVHNPKRLTFYWLHKQINELHVCDTVTHYMVVHAPEGE